MKVTKNEHHFTSGSRLNTRQNFAARWTRQEDELFYRCIVYINKNNSNDTLVANVTRKNIDQIGQIFGRAVEKKLDKINSRSCDAISNRIIHFRRHNDKRTCSGSEKEEIIVVINEILSNNTSNNKTTEKDKISDDENNEIIEISDDENDQIVDENDQIVDENDQIVDENHDKTIDVEISDITPIIEIRPNQSRLEVIDESNTSHISHLEQNELDKSFEDLLKKNNELKNKKDELTEKYQNNENKLIDLKNKNDFYTKSIEDQNQEINKLNSEINKITESFKKYQSLIKNTL
jgi:hypothetical protein